jgi:hypothetical protein
MAKIITVLIDENGDQSVDLAGYQGRGCSAVQKAFEDALGPSSKSIKKPEFYKQVNTKTLQR